MNYLYRAALLTCAAALLISCAKANDTSANIDVRTGKHLPGWLVATSGGAHPAVFLVDPAVCHECHGTDLRGGISAVSCFSVSRNGITCHAGGPSGHPAGWAAAGFHGAAAKAAEGGITVSGQLSSTSSFLKCAQCHGAAYDGGIAQRSCLNVAGCHGVSGGAPHPARPWFSTSGGVTHTTADTGNAGQCAVCHTNGAHSTRVPHVGDATGASGCFNNTLCHGAKAAPHSVPYANHYTAARGNFSYCLGCHQVAANAVNSKPPGCQNCHLSSPVITSTGCTSCHAKPPAGTSYPNIAAVHAAHAGLNVTENTTLTAVCDQCHTGLGLGTIDHLNRARARSASVQANPVAFGSLGKSGGLSPVYNAATRSCAVTYCHGNTLDKPASAILSPVWTSPFLNGNATDCNKCHGYPPATATHSGKTPTDCKSCHSHVNTSGTGFTDATKHINGIIDAVGGHAFPNPGSVHRVAANGSGCLSGCHVVGSAASTYPVTAGTPPDCRSCHLNANPGTDPQCSDCHGSAANNNAGNQLAGSPSGTTFPNRQGQHNRSKHLIYWCTACHPFTNGDARHGWSNRQKSSTAQVKVVTTGTGITSWNAVTKSCTPTCHGTETW